MISQANSMDSARPIDEFKTRYAIGVATCVVAGVCAFAVTAILRSTIYGKYEQSLIPVLTIIIRQCTWHSIPIYFGLAFIIGSIRGFPVAMCGPFMIGVFFLLFIADSLYEPTSHNLFPFEFAQYAALAALGSLAAFLGLGARNLVSWAARRLVPKYYADQEKSKVSG